MSWLIVSVLASSPQEVPSLPTTLLPTVEETVDSSHGSPETIFPAVYPIPQFLISWNQESLGRVIACFFAHVDENAWLVCQR